MCCAAWMGCAGLHTSVSVRTWCADLKHVESSCLGGCCSAPCACSCRCPQQHAGAMLTSSAPPLHGLTYTLSMNLPIQLPSVRMMQCYKKQRFRCRAVPCYARWLCGVRHEAIFVRCERVRACVGWRLAEARPRWRGGHVSCCAYGMAYIL